MTRIAPSPQGSRTGLITALVIFVILFVTAAVFAIYFGTQLQAETQQHAANLKKYAPYVTTADFNAPEVQALIQNGSTGPDALQRAISQRGMEAKLITGSAAANTDSVTADTTNAITAVNKQLAAISNPAGPLAPDNLLGSIQKLASQIVALNTNVTTLQADLKTANEKVVQVTSERQSLLQAKDAEIAKFEQQAKDATAQLAAREAQITKNAQTIQSSADQSVQQAQKNAAAASAEVSKLQGVVKNLQKQIAGMEVHFAPYRIHPERTMAQQPDGYITRVPGNNTVYINLGQGMEVFPGLTFEVYDKVKGMPPLVSPNGRDTELPAGKGSIEIIRVLPGGSECRVIKVATGEHLVEGDIIRNLVYNPNTKYDFVVYGDFDLANIGQPNAADAEVIRRLVTQWGGRIDDHVTVNTDFLVMGAEPKVHSLPENPTPTDTARHEAEQKALDNYLKVQSHAIELGVPILNQNRFLYFTGYYDQATR